MSYQYGYVKAFQYGLMYKANIDPTIVNPPILNVTYPNHITIAIECAFADMANSGALRSKKINKLKPKLLQNNNNQFGNWAGIFHDYMKNGLSLNPTFDDWHNDTCNKILKVLKKASNNKATYGMHKKLSIWHLSIYIVLMMPTFIIINSQIATCHLIALL